MNLIRINIVTLCLMLALVSGAQSGSSTLTRPVTFCANSISKSAFLDSLSNLYQLHFSYNPDLLNADEKVSFDLINEPLYNTLKRIVDDELVEFKAIGSQVIFYPVKPEESAEIVTPFRILKGSVIDKKKGEPIPYCNIGIVGKAMGTMSNSNGHFLVKIPEKYFLDTLIFSCIGFEATYVPMLELLDSEFDIVLSRKNYKLQSIDVIRYDTDFVLDKIYERLFENYDDDYLLFTTFYRETVQENDAFIDISEAVLQVMKAPYTNKYKKDHVKFIKGRKGAIEQARSDIRFKLKGGPYNITRIDVVKNRESFLNPELRHLYDYRFQGLEFIDDRAAAVLSFMPISNLRDILFKGKLYVDVETWAVSRVEFEYTKQGLRDIRHVLIEREPKKCKAIPTGLGYLIQYKLVDGKWHLFSAMSDMNVKIVNRSKREKTRFHSVAEILVTNVEKGDFKNFTRQEIFRSNEIFTDKIVSYDPLFWQSYNIIRPDVRLVKALKTFNNQNLVITNF